MKQRYFNCSSKTVRSIQNLSVIFFQIEVSFNSLINDHLTFPLKANMRSGNNKNVTVGIEMYLKHFYWSRMISVNGKVRSIQNISVIFFQIEVSFNSLINHRLTFLLKANMRSGNNKNVTVGIEMYLRHFYWSRMVSVNGKVQSIQNLSVIFFQIEVSFNSLINDHRTFQLKANMKSRNSKKVTVSNEMKQRYFNCSSKTVRSIQNLSVIFSKLKFLSTL